MFGWLGQLLRVNLTRGTIKTEPLEQGVARTYLGGRGLGTYLHTKEVPASTKPLSAANNLIFATGPLTGTLAPNGGRCALVAKGLPTGAITAASIGGSWGPELKFAGFDAIIFEGKAPEPVCLWITNGAAELRSAGHLWGKTVAETTDLLRSEGNEKARVCCIGPAGENGVSFAVVVSAYSSAAGGAGIGAVMGFKNLKGVAVCGTQGFRVAAPGKFLGAARDIRARIAAKPITCKGLKLNDSVLLAEGVGQDIGSSDGNSAMPHGCFSCSARFSSFVVNDGDVKSPLRDASPAGNEVLRLTGDKQPDRVDGQLQQNGLFTDLGLDFVTMKTILASLSKEQRGDELELARKMAHGGGVSQPSTGWLEGPAMQAAEGGYPPTDHSGCVVDGYMMVPRILHYDGQQGADSASHWRALTAVVDSAVLCPYVLAVIDAGEIAALLSAATGIGYSSDDIVRVGERIAESSVIGE
jgi:aldehyde:ferredoxin oxidoreductase